jgi:hypothetical protein
MKRALLLVAVAGCPSSSPSHTGNPPTLWLAPDQMETAVKLVDHEPPPF